MKDIVRGLMTTALLAAGLVFVGATGAEAQFNVEGRGGVAVPVGDLADLADVGGNVGLGFGYRVHPRINLRLDGDVGFLTGADDLPMFPDMRLWHYNGGAEVSLTPPESRFTLSANLGAGATTIDTDDFIGAGPALGLDFTETYFAANGGLRAGYDLTEQINLFVGGQAYVTFTDEDEFRRLAELSTEPASEDVDNIWSIPVYAGVRVNLPGGDDRRVAAIPAPRTP